MSGILRAVVLLRLQMASRWTSRTSLATIWTRLSIIPSSIISLTCLSEPAQILLRVQTASFQIICSPWPSSFWRMGSTPPCITTSVWSSLPVTKLPHVRSAGMAIAPFSCPISIMILEVIPVSIIWGTVRAPASEQYDKLQQASIKISGIEHVSNILAIMGTTITISSSEGSGFPRMRLVMHQVAFLTNWVSGFAAIRTPEIAFTAPALSIWFQK